MRYVCLFLPQEITHPSNEKLRAAQRVTSKWAHHDHDLLQEDHHHHYPYTFRATSLYDPKTVKLPSWANRRYPAVIYHIKKSNSQMRSRSAYAPHPCSLAPVCPSVSWPPWMNGGKKRQKKQKIVSLLRHLSWPPSFFFWLESSFREAPSDEPSPFLLSLLFRAAMSARLAKPSCSKE